MKNNIKFPAFLILALSLLSTPSLPQSSSRWGYAHYTDGADTLNYRILTSDYDTLRKYPLIMFLHGSGERGTDNEAQLKWGVSNFATDRAMVMYPAIVVAPQCPPDQEWASFAENEQAAECKMNPEPARPMQLVIGLIHQLIMTMQVDTTRIYITGLSMGGYGTFDAIMRYPDLFAAAVPVCGGGDVSRASTIARIPIWIFHGSEDPGVDPRYSLRMAQALAAAGAHPGLTLYPGTGHFAWLAAYSDPMLLNWLFQQHK